MSSLLAIGIENYTLSYLAANILQFAKQNRMNEWTCQAVLIAIFDLDMLQGTHKT